MSVGVPLRAGPDADFAGILALIRRSFAYMDGRVDPPSSMHRLTVAAVRQHAAAHEVWFAAEAAAPVACVFLTAKPDCLYLGKLAVDAGRRGRGHARALVDLAERRARAFGLPALELQARIELTENHATFRALGFGKTGETAHAGYRRPTSITMRKPVDGPATALARD